MLVAVVYFFIPKNNEISINKIASSLHRVFLNDNQALINPPEEKSLKSKDVIPLKITDAIITNGSRDKKQIALTFDADMTYKMLNELKQGKVDKWYDKKIFETLKETSTPATFFITGLWAQTYPDITKDLASSPLFEIGSHSFDHAGFTESCYNLGQTQDKKSEVTKTQKILFNLTGKTPQLFRFPGGCSTPKDVNLAYNLGLQVIGWDTSSGDAFSKNKERIYERTIKTAKNGSIIVMHTGGPNDPKTSAALPQIIKTLKEKGYAFVTISDLLK